MKKILFLLVSLLIACIAYGGSPEWEDAYEAYQKEKWKKAIRLFSKIDKESIEYAKAQRYIGYNIYGRELKDWEKAIEHCIRAYQADENDEKVLEDLGRACLNRQKELK